MQSSKTLVRMAAAALAAALLLAGCGATATVGESAPAYAGEEGDDGGQSRTPAEQEKSAFLFVPELGGGTSPLAGLVLALEEQQLTEYFYQGQQVLQVPGIAQNPELPNGCEITSAAIALGFLGYDVDKTVLAESYLRRQEPYTETDPEEAYMGDPFIPHMGYYCMTGPIVEAVDAYLADMGQTQYHAQDLSGADLRQLKRYLNNGSPVLVWATVRFEAPRYAAMFTLPDGQPVYTNLHCVVLTGYDSDTLYIQDPLGEMTEIDTVTFEESYDTIGRRAVVIGR